MRFLVLVALLAIIAIAFAQTTAKPQTTKVPATTTKAPAKKSVVQKALNKLLKKKVTDEKTAAEKKKVEAILRRLLKKAEREKKIAKLPLKIQIRLARRKLNRRIRILKKILRKITVSSKKDDAEKKMLKKLLREFAVKDLLKAVTLKTKLNKFIKKGEKAPKGTNKAAKLLSDSEFLGSFGRWFKKKVMPVVGQVWGAAKGAALEAGKNALFAAFA